jgi:hypothetical protein
MAGGAGQNHPYDGGGGGGGGGPDGAGGAAGSGDFNGVNGTDGTDIVPIGAEAGGAGSYGPGYVSLTYSDIYGILFEGGSITLDRENGRITHVFFVPGVYEIVGAQ